MFVKVNINFISVDFTMKSCQYLPGLEHSILSPTKKKINTNTNMFLKNVKKRKTRKIYLTYRNSKLYHSYLVEINCIGKMFHNA